MSTKERLTQSPENERGPDKFRKEREGHNERLDERRKEQAGEQAHEDINEILNEVEVLHERLAENHEVTQERQPSPAERRGVAPKKVREAAYKTTMKEVESQLSPASRTFSKIIHNKVVERTSEVTGNTVARPNAILYGALFAFLMTLGVYLVAKNLGYPLSGFETIGAFALGWVLGLLFDFLKVMVTGRK